MARPGLPPPPELDAGWYADPSGRYEARYWNGRKWTSHISHYGATGVDPVRRAVLEERIGLGVLWVLRLVVLVVIGGSLAYAVWQLWPRAADRNLAADRELAANARLQAGDLPQGWFEGPAEDLSVLSSGAGVDDCASFAELLVATDGEPADSRSWVAPDALGRAASTVTVLEDADLATDFVRTLALSPSGGCLETLAEQTVAAVGEVEITDVTVRRMSAIDVGDESTWWRISGRTGGSGLPLEVQIDYVAIRVDRSIAEVTFLGLVQPMDTAVQRAALVNIGQRLQPAEEDDGAADEGDPDATPAPETATLPGGAVGADGGADRGVGDTNGSGDPPGTDATDAGTGDDPGGGEG